MRRGGLAAHEAAGGHLLKEHVGKTAEALLARLASEPNLKAASSFFSREVAEHAVETTLRANEAKIAAWLAQATKKPLAIERTVGRPVGVIAPRGATSSLGVYSSRSIRVVLRKDAGMLTGFRVQTGYPIP